MSIFKRFSGKKSGDNPSESEDMAIDETTPLVTDDNDTPLPRTTDDAIPSLHGFSDNEKDVIKSILTDKALPRSEIKAEVEEPSYLKSAPDKGLHKRNKKKRKEKTTSDILSDESYKSALSILKGDSEVLYDETANDMAPSTISEIIEDIETSEQIEPSRSNYPDRLVASATYSRADDMEDTDTKREDTKSEDIATEDIRAELIEPAETSSAQRGKLGEEDMTSDEPSKSDREDTYDLRKRADIRHEDVNLGQRRVNLGEMRMDVASIISDIETGDSMFRRAQQRVENLTNYIEKAEVDFSLIDRLEPENRALKSENLTLNSELDKRKTKISQLTTSLEDLQRRYGDAQSELDATHSKLAQAIRNHERADRDITDLNSQIQEMRLKSDRLRNDLDVENRENGNLRSRIADATAQLDKTTSEKLNFAKQIETLKIDVTDQSENRIKLRDEVGELRHSLESAQRDNTKMRGEISSVHDDIRGFKTQYEFNILKRDERISDLEAQVVELNNRLRAKEELVENTTRDLAVLRKERTTQDLERERLEKAVSDTNSQLGRAEEELLRSRKTADEMDLKYRDIADALARNEAQRQSSAPAQTPDIAPPPMPVHTAQAPRGFETDDINIATSAPATPGVPSPQDVVAPAAERIAPNRQITDDIEDMLTDYKLGLRNLG